VTCAASRDDSNDIEMDCPLVTEIETLPNEADFLLAMSTVPGYVSYRSKSDGTWFIRSLVQMLEKFAEK